MLDQAQIQRIRAIFLHREPRVTVAAAADILGWSRAEMDATIRDGEIETIETCSGRAIELRELAAYAVQRWPLTAIEEALGRDAGSILPAALRTRKLTVRVPRYQIGALEVLADEGSESVETLVTRVFEELAEVHQQRLAHAVPGLAEAMAWPDRQAG
jgi:hypothetical protein